MHGIQLLHPAGMFPAGLPIGRTMHTHLARILLLLVALTVAVPESFAKRTGGGRSVGRQSSAVARTRPAPPPSPSRAQQAPPQQPGAAAAPRPQPGVPPNAARQELPPNAPERTLPRQASSPWGGFLGGALIGLGLGSLLGDRNDDAVNRSEGDSGTGTSAAGSGENETAQAPQRSVGSVLGWGALAALVIYLVRRVLRRTRRF